MDQNYLSIIAQSDKCFYICIINVIGARNLKMIPIIHVDVSTHRESHKYVQFIYQLTSQGRSTATKDP